MKTDPKTNILVKLNVARSYDLPSLVVNHLSRIRIVFGNAEYLCKKPFHTK